MFWTKFNLDKYREFLFKEMTNLQKIPKIMLRFERFGATILVIRKTLSNFGNVFGNVTNLYFKNQGEKI